MVTDVDMYVFDQLCLEWGKKLGKVNEEEYEKGMVANRRDFAALNSRQQAAVDDEIDRLRGMGFAGSAVYRLRTPLEEEQVRQQAKNPPPEKAEVLIPLSGTGHQGSADRTGSPIGHRGPAQDSRSLDRFGPDRSTGHSQDKGYVDGDEEPERRDVRRIYQLGEGPAGAEHWQGRRGGPGVPRPRDPFGTGGPGPNLDRLPNNAKS